MSNYFDFILPIDLASSVIGGVIGLVLVLVYEYLTKPRIHCWNTKFIKEGFKLGFKINPGTNYKFKFKVSGFRNPGFSELQIHWHGNVIKAKWDDSPNPPHRG